MNTDTARLNWLEKQLAQSKDAWIGQDGIGRRMLPPMQRIYKASETIRESIDTAIARAEGNQYASAESKGKLP